MKSLVVFIFIFLVFMVSSGCTDTDADLHAGSEVEADSPQDMPEFLAPETPEPPVTDDNQGAITFTFQHEQPLSMELLPNMNPPIPGREFFPEERSVADFCAQGFYRGEDTQKHEIYSYIKIAGGEFYELGQVTYGVEDNEYSISAFLNGNHWLTSFETVEIDGSQAAVCELYKSLGAKYDRVDYILLKDIYGLQGLAYSLCEILGVEDYIYDESNGETYILSTDRSLPFTEYTISKLDIDSGVLRYTNLTELLECDSVYYDRDSGMFFTYQRLPDTGEETSFSDGTVYLFDSGMFIPDVYPPVEPPGSPPPVEEPYQELDFSNMGITNEVLAAMVVSGEIPADIPLTLVLGGNSISDLSPLSKLTNLDRLYLQHNPISDLSPLSGLNNLSVLWACNNQISSLSQFPELTGLAELHLGDNEIADISPLSRLSNLKRLYLGGNEITDYTPLLKLTQLKELNLGYNRINDPSMLSEFRTLEMLDISGNNISDITPLSELTTLTVLYVQDNNISDISALSNLVNLSKLYLNKNQITDISVLSELKKLTELDLCDNEIADYSPISGLNHLIEFWRDEE